MVYTQQIGAIISKMLQKPGAKAREKPGLWWSTPVLVCCPYRRGEQTTVRCGKKSGKIRNPVRGKVHR
jgi:hypothetical protein